MESLVLLRGEGIIVKTTLPSFPCLKAIYLFKLADCVTCLFFCKLQELVTLYVCVSICVCDGLIFFSLSLMFCDAEMCSLLFHL